MKGTSCIVVDVAVAVVVVVVVVQCLYWFCFCTKTEEESPSCITSEVVVKFTLVYLCSLILLFVDKYSVFNLFWWCKIKDYKTCSTSSQQILLAQDHGLNVHNIVIILYKRTSKKNSWQSLGLLVKFSFVLRTILLFIKVFYTNALVMFSFYHSNAYCSNSRFISWTS